MPISEKIKTYSTTILHGDLADHSRNITLSLESGNRAYLYFQKVLPNEWLVFNGPSVLLYMTEDQYADIYRVLQSESQAYFTALKLLGIRVGSVHTQDLGALAETGDEDPNSLEAVIRRAKLQQQQPGAVASGDGAARP